MTPIRLFLKMNKLLIIQIKEIEIVESGINDIIQDNGKAPKLPDTSSIFEKVMKMKKEKEKVSMVDW